MNKTIQAFLPTAEAIQRLLHPHAEVVVHNIQKNQVVAIYNPFSKRRVGDSSLFTAEEKMATLEDCVGPYQKRNWDGRKLKSVSSVIRDNDQQAVGMLCINLDISMFEQLQQVVMQFVDHQQLTKQPEPLFKDDWQERINQYLYQYLHQQHATLKNLTRQEKQRLIEHLHQVGAFNGKNAANYIAEIIQISRATVYNYLSKIKKREE